MKLLETNGDDLVLRFEGLFNSSQAYEAQETLQGMRPGIHVSLDFGQVREFQDVAFALLAQDLLRFGSPDSPLRLSVTGLCQHQARILKYLGVPGLDVPVSADQDAELEAASVTEIPEAAMPSADIR
jgi:hypothetical protein